MQEVTGTCWFFEEKARFPDSEQNPVVTWYSALKSSLKSMGKMHLKDLRFFLNRL